MRVLYIQDSLGTGGAERSNAELWYYLREKGVEIKIVVLEHRQEGIEQEILSQGFDVVFLRSKRFFSQVSEIQDVINLFDPDIVQSVLFKAAMRTRFAKLGSNFKNIESLVSLTYSEIRFNDPKVNTILLRLYKFLDRFSQLFGVDHFVAITNEVKSHYQNHLKIIPKKISVVYRGRKENPYLCQKQKIRNSLRESLGIESEELLFIHVGRQEYPKAHLDILKAIKIKDKQLSVAKCNFLFCGRKGNSTAAIHQFINENKLKTKIKFLGHRNDIYELLAAADVFVFPSLFEGLGGSLIEAQAAGLPIICSDIPVFKEVVTRENALFHKVNDPESLSVQFLKVLETDRKRMGEASLKNYVHNFKLEEVNKKMLKLYRNLLK